MLTEVKNQVKVTLLSIKYALMREMLNKVTFLSNVIFMILNNASFIIQWVVLYNLKGDVGGYSFNDVLLLWGIAASSYGVAHFIFKDAFSLSDTINEGSLDRYLVQPKGVLISCITGHISTSALGDFIYGYIMLFLYGFTIKNFLLFTLFTLTGAILIVCLAVIFGSLSFWFKKSDVVAEKVNSLMTNFATYPDGIFKGLVKFILYTIIPVGIANYMPVLIMRSFDISLLLIVIGVSILFIFISYIVFYKGLKKYSSSNLMVARI